MGNSADFSDAEWDVRCNLAACYRAFVQFGWTDFIYTHISVRHPTHYGIDGFQAIRLLEGQTDEGKDS